MKSQLQNLLAIFVTTFLGVLSALYIDRHFHPQGGFQAMDRGGLPPGIQNVVALKDEKVNYKEKNLNLNPGANANPNDVCFQDQQKYCAQAKSADEVGECILKNRADLTADCKSQVNLKESVLFPCMKDIKKLCKDKNFLSNNINSCLKDHIKSLSPACMPLIKM